MSQLTNYERHYYKIERDINSMKKDYRTASLTKLLGFISIFIQIIYLVIFDSSSLNSFIFIVVMFILVALNRKAYNSFAKKRYDLFFTYTLLSDVRFIKSNFLDLTDEEKTKLSAKVIDVLVDYLHDLY